MLASTQILASLCGLFCSPLLDLAISLFSYYKCSTISLLLYLFLNILQSCLYLNYFQSGNNFCLSIFSLSCYVISFLFIIHKHLINQQSDILPLLSSTQSNSTVLTPLKSNQNIQAQDSLNSSLINHCAQSFIGSPITNKSSADLLMFNIEDLLSPVTSTSKLKSPTKEDNIQLSLKQEKDIKPSSALLSPVLGPVLNARPVIPKPSRSSNPGPIIATLLALSTVTNGAPIEIPTSSCNESLIYKNDILNFITFLISLTINILNFQFFTMPNILNTFKLISNTLLWTTTCLLLIFNNEINWNCSIPLLYNQSYMILANTVITFISSISCIHNITSKFKNIGEFKDILRQKQYQQVYGSII